MSEKRIWNSNHFTNCMKTLQLMCQHKHCQKTSILKGKRIAVFSGLGSKRVTFVSCFFLSFLCRKISLNEGNIYFLILLERSIQKFKHICKFFAIQHFYECSLSKTYDNAFLNCTLSIMYFNFYAFLKIFWEFSSCSSYQL